MTITEWSVFDCETGGTIYSGLSQERAQELSFNYPSWCVSWENITPPVKYKKEPPNSKKTWFYFLFGITKQEYDWNIANDQKKQDMKNE